MGIAKASDMRLVPRIAAACLLAETIECHGDPSIILLLGHCSDEIFDPRFSSWNLIPANFFVGIFAS